MASDELFRRDIVALAGSACLSGCTSRIAPGRTERLPVLVGLEVQNDTDRSREYQMRVRYAADGGKTPETVFRSEGRVRARTAEVVEDDWSKEPGRYAVDISVGGRDWHTQDITDRLTQEERICYAQDVSITDDGEAVTFRTNVDAPCPDL